MSTAHNPVMSGNGKLTYWLLALLGTLATGGTMAWLSNTNSSIRDHGERRKSRSWKAAAKSTSGSSTA